MKTDELEERLRSIHEQLVLSRDAANEGLKRIAELRSWLTQCEIKRLKALNSTAGEKGAE